MSDKTLGITATLLIDDVTSGLNDLLGLFGQIPDSITTDINLSGDAESGLTNVSTELDTLNSTQLAIPVDNTSIITLGDDANNTSSDIGGMGTAADDASSTIVDAMTIADNAINKLGDDANAVAGDIGNLGSSGDSTVDTSGGDTSGDGLGTAAVGVGVDASIIAAIDLAGNYEDSMKRIGTTQDHLNETSAQVLSRWGGTMGKMKEDTGRSMGSIRGDIAAMGIVGVHNTDSIIKGFDLMSGAAFNLGQPIENVEKAYAGAVSQGVLRAGTLRAMGVSTQEVEEKTGMKIDEVRKKFKEMSSEQRAAFLNSLMDTEKNRAGIEAFKGSWEETKDTTKNTGDYLGRILGQTVFPIVNKGLDGVNWALGGFAGWLDKLPQPLKTVVDGIIGAGIVFTGFTVGVVAPLSYAMGKFLPDSWKTFLRIADKSIMEQWGSGVTKVFRGVVDLFKWTGGQVVDIIKGWTGWGAEAEKSAWGTFKALESGIKGGSESFTSKVKDFGGKVWDTIRGWKTSWEGSAKNIDFIKDADGTFRMKSPGFIDNVRGYGVKIGDTIRGWKFPKVNLGFLDDIGKGITSKLPDIRNIAGRVPTGVTDGITSKLPSLLGKAGGPAMIVTTVLQGLSGAGENWHKNIVQQTKEAFGIDMWQGLVWSMIPESIKSFIAGRVWVFKIPFDSAVKFLGLDKLNISPEGFWTAIFGKDATKKFGDWLDTSVSGPINHFFMDLPGKIVSWGSGVPGAIEKPFNDAGDWLKKLPANFMKWGGDAIQGLIDGIKSKIPGADGLDGALKQIGDHFPHSPPKTGALADITAGNMKSWMSTIADAGMKGFSDFKLNKVSLPSIPNISNSNISPNSTGSQPNQFNITIDLTLPPGTNSKDATIIGNNIGEGIGSNSILKGLISNGGKPNVLVRK